MLGSCVRRISCTRKLTLLLTWSGLDFVIEYCARGDLLTWINKLDCFDEACTQFYIAELVVALEHMHSRNVIHRCAQACLHA